jgi:NADPH:quinone reductase-like Zn-dependent oxidoreductase
MNVSNTRVVLTRFGGPEGFEVVRGEPLPSPGPGQIRVRTLAASVQFTDVIIRKGMYPDLKEKPPFTPGYDSVGEVDAIGAGVSGLVVGDRVADMTMTGGYAHYRLLDASRVTKVPSGVDPAAAAALVLGGMTAYQLLHREAKVQKGQRVLIHGAAGSVGQVLLELGKLAGLEMYGTARAEHRDLVASYGATPIDYRKEDFARVVPDGYDVVFDGIGEEGFKRSWAAVKKGGFLSAYGFSSGVQSGAAFLTIGMWLGRVWVWNALPNGKRAHFYSITALRKAHPEWFTEDLGALFALLAKGAIAPRVAERIRFDQVADAHRKLEAGGLTGKLVIDPTLDGAAP